jgi:aminomethyltransferase
LLDGTPFILSRSGYTGEVGFEIFIKPEHTVKAWEAIMEAGRDLGLTPCGLASRDSLRTGAVLPLSHQDIGAWTYINHPWSFALPYNAAGEFTKSFLGLDAIKKADNPDNTYAYAGFDLRKIDAHDAVVLNTDGTEIGTVLTCATDMAIGRYEGEIYSSVSEQKPDGLKIRGLSCGFIKVRTELEPGTTLELKDNKRKIKVVIQRDIRPDRTARKSLKNFKK